MSFKFTDFGTNRKLICDFLLVINTNLTAILHRFRDIAVDRLLKFITTLWSVDQMQIAQLITINRSRVHIMKYNKHKNMSEIPIPGYPSCV